MMISNTAPLDDATRHRCILAHAVNYVKTQSPDDFHVCLPSVQLNNDTTAEKQIVGASELNMVIA